MVSRPVTNKRLKVEIWIRKTRIPYTSITIVYFSDIWDNSGIRIFYTNQLRQHEAGVMETGMEITLTQFIPPQEDSFLSEGICSMECLKLVSSILQT